jgi:poly(3-hydroxybutyrate) depolymerase
MTTWVYVPQSAPASASGRALLVGLHGCSQSAADLRDHGNFVQAAEELGMVIALPGAPNGGVIAGCWDYYGGGHTRQNRHNDNVLAMVAALLGANNLGIDAAQVYVAGLSSGASQAMVLGCLAPDVFAGVGINAGPTVGTQSSQIGSVATNLDAAKALCTQLAGAQKSAFATQVASIIHGDNDYTVAVGYNALNAQVLASLYGAPQKTTFSTSALPGKKVAGAGTAWSDAAGLRVTLITNQGLGHNWPAGQGGTGGAFINKNSVNYPLYLGRFFFENNRRKGAEPPPVDVPEPEVPTPPDPNDEPVDSDPVTPPSDPPPTGDPTPVAPTPEPKLVPGDSVVATLEQHIQAKRLTWADYGTHYVKYGAKPFALYFQASGKWSDVAPAGPPSSGTGGGSGSGTGTPTPPGGSSPPAQSCVSLTASNHAHIQAGRAVVCEKWYACAKGSLQKLGLNNTFAQSTLRETSPGYFVKGACP